MFPSLALCQESVIPIMRLEMMARAAAGVVERHVVNNNESEPEN